MATRTAFLLAILLVGCGGGLAGARRDFDKGRTAEAKTKLVALEDESRTWSASDRATYALYRGLVHLAVGDRALAAEWLGRARDAQAKDPDVLVAEDRTRLRLALDAVAERDVAP